MFEQSTLSSGPTGKRVWTTILGVTSQCAIVSFAILVPMVFPQVLPTAHLFETLAPPLPPPAPKPLGESKPERFVRTISRSRVSLTQYQPNQIPREVFTIVDEPEATGVAGVPAGFGATDGVAGGIFQEFIRNTPHIPPPVVAPPVVKPVVEAPVTIPRYTVGGNVQLGTLLHRAEPQYPAIAKSARVSGDVELECVVGVDGHIHEVKVNSGSALLVQAAKDAAWQWVYAPSKLNGNPIEIVTILKFSFKLN
jgi:protein TonB